MTDFALEVQYWPIDRLIPYARNPRTHSDQQVSQIAASILEFGFVNPILVDSSAGIVAGHGRLLAARKLGMSKVPVIVLGHLTPTQRRALVLADNKLALNAGWDEELLRGLLSELREEEFNLDVLGFSDEELDALLTQAPDFQEGLTDEDAVPEPLEEPVSRRGDLWLLGEHRLLCGDATEMASFEKVLAGGRADMAWTDPPYGVDYEGKTSRRLKIANDKLGADFYEFLRQACANMLAATDGTIYICMSSSELHTLYQAFTDAGGHWSTFLIWAKHHFTLGRSDYQRQYEPILYGWRQGAPHYWCGDRDQGDVWFVNRPAANRDHPTSKPVELVERAIRNSSRRRETVLDPFAGSGSTLIACERTGRQGRLIELEPRYCDVIIRRWQEHVGREATLEGDGRTFREIAGERRAAEEIADERRAVPA